MRTSPLNLNPALLESARRRRSAGEGLKALAAEFGITWQKMDKAIRHGFARPSNPTPSARTHAAPTGNQVAHRPLLESRVKVEDLGTVPLVEKYRPWTLAGLWGQPKVVAALDRFARNPCSTAFIFEGETGCGKTTAALALARAVGCDVDAGEWGGVWEIASGEQSADTVREMARRMHLMPLQGSGWKVVIVNEADRMCRPAEVIWLDVLEHLPRRSVVVFTTNDPDLLSARFRDRCTRLEFRSDAACMAAPARDLLLGIWRAETGEEPDLLAVEKMVHASQVEGQISMRRAVQMLAAALLERTVGSEGVQP